MKQETMEYMKMLQWVLLLVALLLFLAGCGQREENIPQGIEEMAVPMSGGVDIDHFGSEEWSGGAVNGKESVGDATKEEQSAPETAEPVEISHKKEKIVYTGEDFMKSCTTIGADSIYLTGFHGEYTGTAPDSDSYFLGRMEKGGSEIQEYDLKVPEDMFAMQGCVDAEGNWHLLFVQRIDGKMTYEKAEPWIIDREGNQLECIDFTEVMKTKPFIPFWMAVDENGNYFLASSGVLMWVDGEGHVKKWFETDAVCGLGVGKSGQVYGVFESATSGSYLGSLDPESGVVEACVTFDAELLSTFSVLQPGVNSELLLANKGNGAWRYDGENLELAVSTGELLGNGQDIMGLGFLDDGRVCALAFEEERYVCCYAPVEE